VIYPLQENFPPSLKEMALKLHPKANVVMLNVYPTGKHYFNIHSDKLNIQKNSEVITVRYGNVRATKFKCNDSAREIYLLTGTQRGAEDKIIKENFPKINNIKTPIGYKMNYEVQLHWKHSLLAEFTFRTVDNKITTEPRENVSLSIVTRELNIEKALQTTYGNPETKVGNLADFMNSNDKWEFFKIPDRRGSKFYIDKYARELTNGDVFANVNEAFQLGIITALKRNIGGRLNNAATWIIFQNDPFDENSKIIFTGSGSGTQQLTNDNAALAEAFYQRSAVRIFIHSTCQINIVNATKTTNGNFVDKMGNEGDILFWSCMYVADFEEQEILTESGETQKKLKFYFTSKVPDSKLTQMLIDRK